MKIMIAIGNRSMGGAQRVAMHLCEWLNNQKNTSAILVSLSLTDNEAYNMSHIPVVELENRNIVGKLVLEIKKLRPDIFLSMGVPMSVYTIPACIITRTRHIVSERNDPKHFAGKKSTKYVSRILMNFADGFVFQTLEAKKFYKPRIQKKAIVIENPIFNIQNMPEKPYVGSRKKEIISVGRLNVQKNHKLLIKAFSIILEKHPEYKLKIFGEGTERKELEIFIKDNQLETKVFLPGNIDNVFDELYDAALFVMSSNFEGMPNALMEAMALGVPCISTDCPCGGPRKLIKNNVNGFLVPVCNEKEMVSIMELLLSNINISREIGQRAMGVRDTYNLDTVCTKWKNYFENVIGNMETSYEKSIVNE